MSKYGIELQLKRVSSGHRVRGRMSEHYIRSIKHAHLLVFVRYEWLWHRSLFYAGINHLNMREIIIKSIWLLN